ncbi:MAG: 1-phosphofructokinase family hexose kinase [Roseiflexaceae bacterium]
MLLLITTNPSIDRLLLVPGFRPAEVARVRERSDAAGGKGMNAARVARTLGQPVRICAPLGGQTGQQIAELAHNEGFEAAWYWMQQGESRICLLISDPAAHDTLVINEPGPAMSLSDWAGFAEHVRTTAAHSQAVAFCGSLMPNVPPICLPELARALLAQGQQVLVDISGAPLRAILDTPISLLKINADELAEALGQPITDLDAAYQAAKQVRQRGPQAVIITMGKEGALGVDASGAYHATTPPIQAVSTVGSGDALLAGVATGLLRGQGFAAALRLGVACGAANALQIGAGRVDSNQLHTLLEQSSAHPYSAIQHTNE